MPIFARIGTRIAPPRFILFCGVLGAGLAALVPVMGPARGTLAAFDGAAIIFLIAVAPLFGKDVAAMRDHARDNDANRALLLAISVLVSLVVLAAVFSEMRGRASASTITLVVATLALAWLFSNIVYTLHYAHLYYSAGDDDDDDDGTGRRDRGGIDFPGDGEPNYWDFAYFAFTIGMTFQTSDVEITATGIRRTATGHGLAAFVFNIGVLAFSINVLGSASGG